MPRSVARRRAARYALAVALGDLTARLNGAFAALPTTRDATAMRILAWIDTLGDPLTLYRELVVDNAAAINFHKLGRFWSADMQAATSPFGRTDRPRSRRFLVTVRARRHDVDKAETIATMRRYPDELEVRLRDGAPVEVAEVRDSDGTVPLKTRSGLASPPAR